MKIIAKPLIPISKMRFMNMIDYSDYDNCIQLVFTKEDTVELFDYKSTKQIGTIKF